MRSFATPANPFIHVTTELRTLRALQPLIVAFLVPVGAVLALSPRRPRGRRSRSAQPAQCAGREHYGQPRSRA
jgi:hypothetical protein